MIPMSMRVKGAIDAWIWGAGFSPGSCLTPCELGRPTSGYRYKRKKCSDNSSSSMRLRPEFRHRSPRLEELRKAVPSRRRRVGADRVASRGMRLRDNRALPRIAQMCCSTFALPRGRTGLGSRAERQDQAPSCSLRALVRPEIPLTSRHRSFQSCWQSGHAMVGQISCIRYRAGVPESRIGTPIFRRLH